MILVDIVNRIKQFTELDPVVKGGDRRNPIEISWSRQSKYNFRLEVWIHGDDLLELQSLSDEIVECISDVGDTNTLNGSIELTGGGSFAKDNIISMAMYFNVVDYSYVSNKETEHLTFPFTFKMKF